MEDTEKSLNIGIKSWMAYGVFAIITIIARIVDNPNTQTALAITLSIVIISIIFEATLIYTDFYLKYNNWTKYVYLGAAIVTYMLSSLSISGFVGAILFFPIAILLMQYFDKKINIMVALTIIIVPQFAFFLGKTKINMVDRIHITVLTIIMASSIYYFSNCMINLQKRLEDKISNLSKNTNYLKELVSSIKILADNVIEESNELDNKFDSISDSTNTVVKAIGEISSGSIIAVESIENSAELLEDIKILADDTINSSNKMQLSVIKSKKVVTESLSKVENLSNKTKKFMINAKNFESIVIDLKNRNNDINKIINVITDIADDTNLLSFNTTIEASHVKNEEGSGFKVVAEEIKKLSTESRENSKQIELILNELTKKTDTAAKELNELLNEAEIQEKLVQDTGEAFSNIMDIVSIVEEETNITNKKIKEVMEKNNQIHFLLNNVNAVMQETVACVEEATSKSSRNLELVKTGKSLSIKLKDKSKEFKKFI